MSSRSRYLGGSDAAAALGISPYKTPFQLWLEKTGQTDGNATETAPMRWGTKLEAVVADAYAEQTGRTITDGPRLVDGFRAGSLDRITVPIPGDDIRIVEIKTARRGDGWGEVGTDDIPLHYAAQGLHYLSLLPRAVACDFPVLISGSDFRIYTLHRDDALIAQLVEAEVAWWRRHVEGNQPPEPLTTQDYQRRWRTIEGKVVRLDDVGVATARELANIRERMKFYAKAEEEVSNRLRAMIGDGEVAEGPDGAVVATWKEQEARPLDVEAVRAAHPEIAEKLTKVTTSRVLRLKIKEEK